jgi:hypothetical protein
MGAHSCLSASQRSRIVPFVLTSVCSLEASIQVHWFRCHMILLQFEIVRRNSGAEAV